MEASVAVLIPAYNEGRHIRAVLQQIPSFVCEVVVVDDGSVDDTGVKAREGGASVVRNQINSGKGYSIMRGLEEIESDIVVLMDADGQHDPQYIPQLVSPIVDDRFDLVVGNRFAKGYGDMPFLRRLSNTYARDLCSLLCASVVPDPLCGYRALRREDLRSIVCCPKYGIEIDVLLRYIDGGKRIASIPIPKIYREEESSLPFMSSLQLGYRLFWEVVRRRLCR